MPTSTRIRARNYVAMSPLLRKGGVHERSKSGARANVKHEMQNEMSNWREALEQECLSTTDHPRDNSGDDTLLQKFNRSITCFLYKNTPENMQENNLGARL